MKSIPIDDIDIAITLLKKRCLKLIAVVSTYVTGKKHVEFNEKWDGERKTQKNIFVNLKKYYKTLTTYLTLLCSFIEHKKCQNSLDYISGFKTGRKVEQPIRGLIVRSSDISIEEIVSECDILLRSVKMDKFSTRKIIETQWNKIASHMRKEKYDNIKEHLFRIKKIFDAFQLLGEEAESRAYNSLLLSMEEIRNCYNFKEYLLGLDEAADELKKLYHQLKERIEE